MVERNRYLIETTRTFLIHGEVHQHFWSDVILIACYLINRMSFLVLDNKIPLPLKVFGSICFVHNFDLGLDKLSLRRQKCVFFWVYSITKMIQVVFTFSNNYFVSANVIFNEFSFYFKDPSSSNVCPSTIVNIYVICDPPIVHSPPSYSPPPPLLKVYNRRHHPQ